MKKVYDIQITNEELAKHFEEKEVLYRDYKSVTKPYQHYMKKADSYNPEKKTIVLYVPKYYQLAEDIAKIKRDTYKNAHNEELTPDNKRLAFEGSFNYEKDYHSGWDMMYNATVLAIKTSDEELEKMLNDNRNNYHVEMKREIAKKVIEYRKNLD